MKSDCIVFCALKLSIENLSTLNFLARAPVLFPFLTVLATDGNNQLTKTCFPLEKTPKIDIHSMKSTSG